MGNERRLALFALLVPAAVALAALALVAAGAAAEPGSPRDEGKVLEETADDFGQVAGVAPGCYLENNAYNRSRAQGGTQRVYRSEVGGQAAFGWEWRWENDEPVFVAYPEVICGVKPFTLRDPVAGFPFQQGKRGLTVEYDLKVEATGRHGVGFSLWAVSFLPPSARNITHEIQIHVLPMESLVPAWQARKLGPVTLDGVAWDVWWTPNGMAVRQGDRAPPPAHTWPLYTFAAREPRLHGPLHIALFLQHLVDLQVLPAGAWITDLELGSGVVQGEGWVRVTRFALR